ncbi:MAG: hypothetical protein P1U39_08740 [Legionellaceae bacterium]|nr:hypothetical protein [Legionellaceae bacterium]
MPESTDDQEAYTKSLNDKYQQSLEYIKNNVQKSDQEACKTKLNELLNELKKKNIYSNYDGFLNGIFWDFEQYIDDVDTLSFDVQQVILNAFKSLEADADSEATVDESLQGGTYQKDSVSAPAPYGENIAEESEFFNEQHKNAVSAFNYKLTEAQAALQKDIQNIITDPDDWVAWKEPLETLMSELQIRGKEVLDDVFRKSAKTKFNPEQDIDTLNNNLAQVLSVFINHVAELNDAKKKCNAEIQSKDCTLEFFYEPLNERIEEIRKAIVEQVPEALYVDNGDCEFYCEKDLSQCTQEDIEKATAEKIKDVDDKIKIALTNLVNNVIQARTLFEEYSKHLISFKTGISADESQQEASVPLLSTKLHQVENYLSTKLQEAIVSKGDKAENVFKKLEAEMKKEIKNLETLLNGICNPSSSVTYDETTSEERDDAAYASGSSQSFNVKKALAKLQVELNAKIDKNVKRYKNYLRKELNQTIANAKDILVDSEDSQTSFNEFALEQNGFYEPDALAKYEDKLAQDKAIIPDSDSVEIAREESNDAEPDDNSVPAPSQLLSREESTDAEADDNSVPAPSQFLSKGERIKAIEERAKLSPDYNKKRWYDQLKYILSELVSPGQRSEDNSENRKEKLKESEGLERTAITAPSVAQKAARERTKARLDLMLAKHSKLKQYERNFDAIKNRVGAVSSTGNPDGDEEIARLLRELDEVEQDVAALTESPHGDTASSEGKPLTEMDKKTAELLRDIRNYKAELTRALPSDDFSSQVDDETKGLELGGESLMTPLEPPPNPRAEVLTFLKSYLDTLKKHEGPEHPVRAQLVRTIQTIDRKFIDKDEPPVSPRRVAQGPGASEPAAVEQDVTPEKHLALLKELDEKLVRLLQQHKTQLHQDTVRELGALRGIVKDSIRAVKQQVIKEQAGALRQSSEEPGRDEPTLENRGPQNQR